MTESPTEHSDIEAPEHPGGVDRLALLMLTGTHRGARHGLANGQMLLLGSAADCDVILSDEGVAGHHCVVHRQGNRVLLRPIDAQTRVNGRRVTSVEAVTIGPGTRIGLGEAHLSVIGLPAEAAAAEPAWLQRIPPRLRQIGGTVRQRTVAAGLAAGAVLCGALLSLALTISAAPVPVERAGNAAQEQGAAATDAASADAARDGGLIAEDVREILRLSGILARTESLGDGRVKASGHLGEPERLAEVIQSRAMRDVDGLRQVVAVNLDASQDAADGPRTVGDKRVTTVVGGDDPYIVTADGARYYPGARLPIGAWLVGVDGDYLLLDDGRRMRRVYGTGLLLSEALEQDV